MRGTPVVNDPAGAAAETTFAAAAELGTTRQEAILATRAVHAVENGRPAEVALTGTAQHRRRKLAHVAGCASGDPALDADAVLAAVVDAGRAAPRERQPSAG